MEVDAIIDLHKVLYQHQRRAPARASDAARAPDETVAIPVRALEGAKSRLGAVLDAEERRDLVEGLLRLAVDAALRTQGVGEVIVVSPDPEVLAVAEAAGAAPPPAIPRPEPRAPGGA